MRPRCTNRSAPVSLSTRARAAQLSRLRIDRSFRLHDSSIELVTAGQLSRLRIAHSSHLRDSSFPLLNGCQLSRLRINYPSRLRDSSFALVTVRQESRFNTEHPSFPGEICRVAELAELRAGKPQVVAI